MEYLQYGNAGLMVSRLCFGAMNFYEHTDEAGAARIVDEAIEAGINFFDTADAYGDNGRSEEVLGKALKQYRDHVVIASKLWVQTYPDDPNGRGCGRYHMTRAVEDSLRRLGTDRIDLYQLHHPDKNAPVEETLSTLDNLVKQGKIRYYGVSNHYAWQMAHMLGVSSLHNWEPLVSIQCCYNIFDRVVENETMHFCKRFNIAAITYSPLAGGLLSGKISRDQAAPEGSRVKRAGLRGVVPGIPAHSDEQHEESIYGILDEIERIAAKYNIGVNQLAMKWIMAKDWVTCPILGGSRSEHFSCMYNLFDINIDEEDIKHLDEISAAYRYVPFRNQAIVGGASTAKNWL